MADEILYADLNIPAELNRGRQLRPTKRLNAFQTGSHWHQIVHWSGWAGTIILLVTMIILVLEGSFHKGQSAVCLNTTEEVREYLQVPPECSPCPGNITHLKSTLCDSTTGSLECKLCPMNWLPEKGRCYWFSKETKFWSGARDDCTRKGAHMLVIQDKAEKEFILNNMKGKNHFWIGLQFSHSSKKWIWVDGSLLDKILLSLPDFENKKACGAFKSEETRPEMCSDEFQWICEKEAIVI